MNQNQNKNRKWLGALAVSAVALGTFGLAMANRKAAQQVTVNVPPTTSTAAANSGDASSASASSTGGTGRTASKSSSASGSSSAPALAYKNGTYEATGSYDSPAGMEKIAVTLTIKNDAIASASVTPLATDRESSHYQSLFIGGYQAQVVGKPVNSINLTYVSGSSLTPIGFDQALASIKAQAKA